MLGFKDDIQVFVYLDHVDMRKSINGLSAMVLDQLEMNPQMGNVFVFCNRARNKVKCLYWDRNGFVLHYKRLERGRFRFASNEQGVIELSHDQLNWLLAGLDFQLMDQFSELNYAHYY